MEASPNQIERARTYWWMIYTKCRQIAKRQEKDSGKVVAFEDLWELSQPCGTACAETRQLLKTYLERSGWSHSQAVPAPIEPVQVKISSIWLWSNFGYLFFDHFLESKETKPYCDEQIRTPQEHLEFYQRLSTFALFLLREVERSVSEDSRSREQKGDQPPLEVLDGFSYRQFTRALFFLLSEYCHENEFIRLPRELDIESHLHKALGADAYLYISKEWYRDHVYHVIDVCLLGWFLLSINISEEKSLLKRISESCGMKTKTFLRNWFLAALFHDIGYSLEEEEKKKQEFKNEFEKKGYTENLETCWEIEKLKRTISSHRRNVRLLELRKAQFGEMNVPISVLNEIEAEKEETDQLEMQLDVIKNRPHSQNHYRTEDDPQSEAPATAKLDHGERSAQYVEKLLKSITGPSGNFKEYAPAIQAIRMHTLMTEKVNARDEPLSFLLILCDELQDWNRPRVNPVDVRERIESQIIFSELEPLPTRKMLDHLSMSIQWGSENNQGSVAGEGFNFRLNYKEASDDFQPLAVWLLKIYNLQRLRVDDEVFKFSICLRQPLSQELRKLESPDVCEHNILRNFMREHRKWHELKNWFDSNDILQWDNDKTGAIPAEILSIQPNRFTERPLLPEDPGKLFDELFQYRQDFISGKRREL